MFLLLKLKYQQLKIIVKDSGSGILYKDQPYVFDPLYTTKSIDRGTGLGLSIVKSVVENDFKGSILFFSQPNQGTIFVVTLPHEKL